MTRMRNNLNSDITADRPSEYLKIPPPQVSDAKQPLAKLLSDTGFSENKAFIEEIHQWWRQTRYLLQLESLREKRHR